MKFALVHIQLLLVLAFVGPWAPQTSAQFTYFGGDSGFRRMSLDGEGKGSLSQGVITVQGLFRPFRNIGIGASYAIPFATIVNYDLKGTRVWQHRAGRSAMYEPNISNFVVIKEEYSLFVRLFPSTEVPLYFDIRLRSYLLSQTYEMVRPYHPPVYSDISGQLQYPEIPQYSNGFALQSRSLCPGFGIGTLSHVGEKGFLFSSFELDRVEFNVPVYTMKMVSGLNYSTGQNEYTTISNTISTPTLAWTIRFGGGIRL